MNGGVHVVRMKMNGMFIQHDRSGTGYLSEVCLLLMRIGKLYVEKRFTRAQLPQARQEIKMIHRLKHSALTFYTGAFIDDAGGFASM